MVVVLVVVPSWAVTTTVMVLLPTASAIARQENRGREMGGVVLAWDSLDFATDYTLETSDDGARWETAYAVAGGNGGRDPLYLPETETRHLRLRVTRGSRGQGVALRKQRLADLGRGLTRPEAVLAQARQIGTECPLPGAARRDMKQPAARRRSARVSRSVRRRCRSRPRADRPARRSGCGWCRS